MIVAFVVASAIIALLLPSKYTVEFDCNQGEAWEYETLIADFNFPLLKSDDEYDKDVEDAKERFLPIYTKNTDVAEDIKVMINHRLFNYTSSATGYGDAGVFKDKLWFLIDSIYSVGVIQNRQLREGSSGNLIRVVDGGKVSTSSLNTIFTLAEAQKLFNAWMLEHADSKDESMQDYISANIIHDESLSDVNLQDVLSAISPTKGFISAGTEIIKSGDVVDASSKQLIESYKQEYILRNGDTNSILGIIGNFIYVFVIMFISYIFLFNFRQEFVKSSGNVFFILFIYVLMAFMSYAISKIDGASLYILPYAIVPFYVVTFYDIRMSIFEYITILLICAPFSHTPIEFLFINLFAGLAGVFIMQNSYHRRRLFVAVGVIYLMYNIGYIAISFMNETSLSSLNWRPLLWFPLNIIFFLALYQLIYLLEKTFGFVTDITLLELCDTNHFLLRELAEKAPGTFQHSVQVANLAEAAAKAIGVNPLYARTGALYHDIGKMENPQYFIENSTSELNLHNKLEPEESVKIIKRHISDGIMLAYRYKLPNIIVDFIASHHAKSLIYFFYHQQTHSGGEQEVDKEAFSYDGPSPTSKEATICMMADSIEAASRSLKDYTPDTISELVDSVVDVQVREGSFENSELSYAEMTQVKEVFKSKIARIYHVRIEYPDRD